MDARALLETDRARARQRLAALSGDFDEVVAASRDTNADDEHDPEGATIAFERSQVGALLRQVRSHLAEVEAALSRVDAGTYGVCERCGRPISAARLEAAGGAGLRAVRHLALGTRLLPSMTGQVERPWTIRHRATCPTARSPSCRSRHLAAGRRLTDAATEHGTSVACAVGRGRRRDRGGARGGGRAGRRARRRRRRGRLRAGLRLAGGGGDLHGRPAGRRRCRRGGRCLRGRALRRGLLLRGPGRAVESRHRSTPGCPGRPAATTRSTRTCGAARSRWSCAR